MESLYRWNVFVLEWYCIGMFFPLFLYLDHCFPGTASIEWLWSADHSSLISIIPFIQVSFNEDYTVMKLFQEGIIQRNNEIPDPNKTRNFVLTAYHLVSLTQNTSSALMFSVMTLIASHTMTVSPFFGILILRLRMVEMTLAISLPILSSEFSSSSRSCCACSCVW